MSIRNVVTKRREPKVDVSVSRVVKRKIKWASGCDGR